MADTTFTPGPWLIRQGFIEDEIEVYPSAKAPHGLQKAEIATVKDYHDDYEANAHLIAAAPELYEALCRLVRDCEIAGLQEQAGFDCWINMANKALAKARGEAV